MRKFITALTTSALFAAAAIAAPAGAAHRLTPDEQLAKMLDGRVAGKSTNCISLPWSDSSRIIEGRAIVYRQGGTLWVNRLRSGADQLRDDDVLVTRVTGGQLCSIDSVTLVDRTSRIPRGFVILGDFVPYRLPPKAPRTSS